MEETKISELDFLKIGSDLLQHVIRIDVKAKIDLHKIAEQIFKSKTESVSLKELNGSAEDFTEIENAFVMRIFVIEYILKINRTSNKLQSTKSVWDIVYFTILKLETEKVNTSVGSQGFASIVIYRREDEGDIKILRLHIWDKSLSQYLQVEDLNSFAIHSHKFHAQSWILSGEIINTRFSPITESISNQAFFKIDWEEKNGQWNSFLSNTMKTTSAIANSIETYQAGATYMIDSGDFHKSEVNLDIGISATLFLFNSKINAVDLSYVIGPKSRDRGPNYQYTSFEANQLLKELNNTIQ